jgi:cobalt/nickel transport protein
MKILGNLLLIAAIVALMAVALLMPRTGDSSKPFPGSDDQGKEVIKEVAPSYKPWFDPVWVPPEGEVETLLFSVQSALGAGFLGYMFGYFRGRAARKEPADRPR